VPIALVDEGGSTPLDRPLSLDRRGDLRERSSGTWEAITPVPLDWEMAPPAEGTSSAPRPSVRSPSRQRPASRPVPLASPGPAREPEPAPADFDVDPDVVAIEVHRHRAPPWRRAAAWAVDGALLGALLALLLLPVIGKADLLPPQREILVPVILVVALLAFAYQWLGVTLTGATPGMRLLALRVVGPDGERPTPGRSAVRALLALPSAAFLGVGLLLALFTREGRGAHDLGSGTWVVLGVDGGRGT
jgi:uncharacterized RDD family membrane protein YckC